MSELNPMLLLMFGLLGLAALTAWGLCIYVAARLARRKRQRLWRWVLPAILPGPIFVGIGYLARSCRRSAAGWVAAQAASAAAVIGAGAVWLPQVFGASLAVDILLLGGSLLVAFSPLLALAALGPRPRAPVETKAE